MSHEPKLTVYTIQLKPVDDNVENSNKQLFKYLIGDNSDDLKDSFIMTEVFRKFIKGLDTPEMFSDPKSRKCMTANQPDIQDPNVNPNIVLHSNKYIIEGKVEGGSFGRRRNKTSTVNKKIKSTVDERDAITEDFYFMIYCPLQSNKSVLFVQSYSDDAIDNVMKKFWLNFLSSSSKFNQPQIKRFIPKSIIEDFKTNSTVSSFTFSTDVPSETLLDNVSSINNRNFKVTINVSPIDGDLSLEEFEKTIEPLQNTIFTKVMKLGQFNKKKGVLKDTTTDKTSPFDLGTSFEIHPSILLSKYVEIKEDESDFNRIKNYCIKLLENIKSEIYIHHAVQER